MPVEIKELIIKGRQVPEGSSEGKLPNERKLIETINSIVSKKTGGGGIKETDRRSLIDECVTAVLNELESKLGY